MIPRLASVRLSWRGVWCIREHNKLSFSTYGERVNVHS
eukprot:COSAG06_NODE_66739_length_253_cov_1.337662_1_plen_37_part_01